MAALQLLVMEEAWHPEGTRPPPPPSHPQLYRSISKGSGWSFGAKCKISLQRSHEYMKAVNGSEESKQIGACRQEGIMNELKASVAAVVILTMVSNQLCLLL